MGESDDNGRASLDASTAKPNGLRYALPILATIAVVDQVSKSWAISRLENVSCSVDGACIDLVGSLRLHLVYNTGVAFTTGSSLGIVWGLLAAVVACVLLYMASQRPDKLGAMLLGLVAGGAIGNLADRLFRGDSGFLSGAVVDFIDLQWWPVFNVADAAIVCGVLGLLASSFLVADTNSEADQTEASEAAEEPELADDPDSVEDADSSEAAGLDDESNQAEPVSTVESDSIREASKTEAAVESSAESTEVNDVETGSAGSS